MILSLEIQFDIYKSIIIFGILIVLNLIFSHSSIPYNYQGIRMKGEWRKLIPEVL